MRKFEEHGCDPRTLPKGDHWYQTHLCAHDFLNKISLHRGFGPIEFKDVHRYFAHTNSAKCKDAGQGTAQGRGLLFKNCRRFIAPEVVALRPDIVVTQGAFARDALEGAFPVLQTARCPANDMYRGELVSVGGRSVLKFMVNHPKARGGLYQREKQAAYGWYVDVAHRFMLGGTIN